MTEIESLQNLIEEGRRTLDRSEGQPIRPALNTLYRNQIAIMEALSEILERIK